MPFCSSLVNRGRATAMAGVTWILVGVGAILGATLGPLWYVANFKHQSTVLLTRLHLSFGQIYSLLNAAHDSKQVMNARLAAFPAHYHALITHALQSSVVSGYKGACMLNVIFAGLVCVSMLFYMLFLNNKHK